MLLLWISIILHSYSNLTQSYLDFLSFWSIFAKIKIKFSLYLHKLFFNKSINSSLLIDYFSSIYSTIPSSHPLKIKIVIVPESSNNNDEIEEVFVGT